jgi:hypothetical protein
MIEIACEKCGKVFKVSEIVNWKYSHWCDHCIQRDQPRDTQDPREAKEDARLDFIESSRELYELTK